MKIRSLAIGVVALTGAGMGQQGLAQADEPSEVLCNPASHELDAVRAAPAMHRVVFENERVRVLEIVLPPLAVEPVHVHALPSVITGDTGGGEGARFLYTSYRYDDGRWIEEERNEIEPTPGRRTVWAAPEGPHSIANIGAVPVRFQRIEVKPEACAAS